MTARYKEAMEQVSRAARALDEAYTAAERALEDDVLALLPVGYTVVATEYDGEFRISIRRPTGEKVAPVRVVAFHDGVVSVAGLPLAEWVGMVLL